MPSPRSPAPGATAPLRASRLFGAVPDAVLADLARQATRRAFEEGEHLWWAGDTPTHFTLVEHGLVQVQRTNAAGSVAILGLFGAGDSVGDVAVLQRRVYPADALATSTRVTMIEIPAEPVLALLPHDPGLAMSVQQSLTHHLDLLFAKVDVLTAGTVANRLATLFLALGERFGRVEGAHVRVPLALSRGALANLIGARSETVIRVLTPWSAAGLVRSEDDGFLLDVEGLREAATAPA